MTKSFDVAEEGDNYYEYRNGLYAWYGSWKW